MRLIKTNTYFMVACSTSQNDNIRTKGVHMICILYKLCICTVPGGVFAHSFNSLLKPFHSIFNIVQLSHPY